MEAKITAVVLNRQWADEMRPIIKPYLLPASAGLNNLPVLYATEVIQGGFFVIVKPEVSAGEFQPLISIPSHMVTMIFESSKESVSAGFVGEQPEESLYGLGHLVRGG